MVQQLVQRLKCITQMLKAFGNTAIVHAKDGVALGTGATSGAAGNNTGKEAVKPS